MVDRRPRLIARCSTTDDVVRALTMARQQGLEVGVRCGGHGVLGLAVPEDGLMIDLTPMGVVRVDPGQRKAWVEGGALLGELDAASQVHGLATTAGNVSHTGVGGLTLGGGMGWLARQYGLACDNVSAFFMVTASGELLRASAEENKELYWGLRGGGGNFGIVTEFEFRLHDIGTRSLVAEYGFPVGEGKRVLRSWCEMNEYAPRQATFTAAIGSDSLLTVGFVWVGDPAHAEPLQRAFESLGTSERRIRELSYVDLQRMDDSVEGHHFRRYSKGHYLRAFPDEAIEVFLERGGPAEHPPSVGLQAYGGAIADVPDDDTAFSHRATLYEWGTSARWSDPAEDAARVSAARDSATALEPFASGVYVNALTDDGAEGVRRAYSEAKLARLTALKNTFDPANVFHLNQNIQPDVR